MIDKLKWYLIDVATKKYVPMALMSGLAWVGAYMMAHAGVLEQYGITYGTWPFTWPVGQEPSGPCILVELDTLSMATTAVVIALVATVARAAQHHTTGNAPAIPSGEAAQ